MIISFHNFYSIWKAFGEALGSFQEARRPTFGLKMEVRRQVPLVLRAIFQHQAPHHLSNVPPWSQNKLKIIPKFIPMLFRSEILQNAERGERSEPREAYAELLEPKRGATLSNWFTSPVASLSVFHLCRFLDYFGVMFTSKVVLEALWELGWGWKSIF